MRLEQLEYFVETAKQHTMSGAAQELSISPQNISKAISQLERELGATLFSRSKQGVTLTPIGESVFAVAAEILDKTVLLKTICQDVPADRTLLQGSFSISVAVSLADLLTNLVNTFLLENPRVSIRLSGWDGITLDDILKHDPYDIACLGMDEATYQQFITPEARTKLSADYQVYFLQALPLRLFMSRSSPLAAQKTIALAKLNTLPFVCYWPEENSTPLVANALKPYHVDLTPALKTSNLSLSMQHIASGKYYALLTALSHQVGADTYGGQIISRPLAKKILWYHILIIKREAALPAQKLLENILSVFHKTAFLLL